MLTVPGVASQDIFRKYPNKYESIIGTLCESLDRLDEPEAKASMIWIIGEYAERIDNADELLDTFLETFPDETSVVQLQLLTSSVKLFLKKPTELAQQMISKVLSAATSEADNPDLRDRAFVYWRLLSTDPEVRCVMSIGWFFIDFFRRQRISCSRRSQSSQMTPTISSRCYWKSFSHRCLHWHLSTTNLLELS